MWIPNQPKLPDETELPLIDRGYQDLLFDDRPILFTGISKAGERVIGSSVEEGRGVESFLHAIVSLQDYAEFTSRRINYPQLLRQASRLFLIQWSDKPCGYLISFYDIPAAYRPSEEAFCPIQSEPCASEQKGHELLANRS
jgi:hypothetical protein